MKRSALLLFASACFYFNAQAQTRKLRQDEINFYNNLHQVLYDAIPHQYKDWRAVGDKKDFDAIKYFCPIVYADNDCTGKTDVALGTREPYQLSYNIEFWMPGDQSDALKGSAMGAVKDYSNAPQIAGMLKSIAKTKLSIRISANVYAPDGGIFTLIYCPKTTPEAIALPVTATLALIGIRSAQCPLMADGRPDLSPGDGYYDDAVVFLGKPVNTKTPVNRSDGLTRTAYGIGFDKSKIGSPVVQNIVVDFKGDADDIRAVIKLMDWQKLYALIAKN
jgi:hypothetical protein